MNSDKLTTEETAREYRYAYGSMDLADLAQHNAAYEQACDKRKALTSRGVDCAMRRDSLSHEYVVTVF